MTNQTGAKFHIPLAKVIAFCASLIVKAKGGITKEEGHELLGQFLEIFAEVLQENIPQIQ